MRRLAHVLQVAVLAWALIAGQPSAASGSPASTSALLPEAVDEQVWRAPIAPGIALVTVRRLDKDGWLDLFAVVADLDVPGVGADVLASSSLTHLEPVSELAGRAGALAAINGDFFHAGVSGAPAGVVVKGQQVWKSPYPSGRPSAVFFRTSEGLRAAIGMLAFDGALRPLPGPGATGGTGSSVSALQVDALNEPALLPGQVGAYDEHWGTAALPLVRWGPEEVAFARLRAERPGGGPGDAWTVVAVGRGVPKAPPGPGELVLLGWRDGATRLQARLRAGQRFGWQAGVVPGSSLRPSPPAGGTIYAALSGGSVLLQDGQPLLELRQPGYPLTRQPRSAIGVGRQGRRVILAAVDGRHWTSRGLDVAELARWLQRLGATDAINLDGGGSTTLVARIGPGSRATEGAQAAPGPPLAVVNRPSDGGERAVPAALGLFYDPGAAGPPGLFVLRPAVCPPAPAIEAYSIAPAGLVTASGVPAPLEVYPYDLSADGLLWTVDPPDLGLFPKPGVFVGLRPGNGRIVALRTDGTRLWGASGTLFGTGDPLVPVVQPGTAMQAAASEIPVQVIGAPVALRVEPDPLVVPPGEPVPLGAVVVDAQGRRAPIDPNLITFWVSGGAEGGVKGGMLSARPSRASGEPALEAGYLDLRVRVAIRWAPSPPHKEQPAAGADSRQETGPVAGPVPPVKAPPPAAEDSGRPAAGAPAPRSTTAGSSGSEAVRVVALGSLPPPASLPGFISWLVDQHPSLVLAALRPPAPDDPAEVEAGWLLETGLPVAAIPAAWDEAHRRPGSASGFGWPGAVATRGESRFIVLDPETVAWEWVAAEIRRAVNDRIRRLLVLTGRSPLRAGAGREEQMLAAWLSATAGKGLETWVLYAGDGWDHRMVDGVHFLSLPPVRQNGPVVVLRIDRAGVAASREFLPAAQARLSEEAAAEPLRPAPFSAAGPAAQGAPPAPENPQKGGSI
ncbi:phosphodiester glycosidase family protein [Carboxydochorda subterranea]|uniref:Phosphodiester glycosidase family protein n=1 Tax=Carboxydichorda subterranea TaxID=3109565 RepID=A0ABZ1C0E6_9FIRM|nr:phosphodiester glycosidase family protein [Limnochorda sp. L945t]WRP17797.1 phosphodiester glycosidase family protein [Limnochorda sp. L945t]